MNERPPRVKTTQTSFRIIETIEEDPGIGVSELARKVNIAKSAAHKHLQTLVGLNYLVREDNEYYLSNRFLSLGLTARERLPLNIAERVVDDLADTTGHITNFVVHENGKGVYALRSKPSAQISDEISEGKVVPLHATAGGKAILAFFSKEKREQIVEQSGLTRYTDKTITERDELERVIQSVRDRRIAFDREEYLEGHQCVASPILNSEGEPVAAVSVTGNIEQMSGKRLEVDFTGLVASAAKSIEKELLST